MLATTNISLLKNNKILKTCLGNGCFRLHILVKVLASGEVFVLAVKPPESVEC